MQYRKRNIYDKYRKTEYCEISSNRDIRKNIERI